jgi:hypothetical protein
MSSTSNGYQINGTVLDRASGRPMPGLRVRGYDKDAFRDQLLGDGYTDASGHYRIAFDRDDLTGPVIRFERHPDIFLVLFDQAGRQVYSTESSVVVDAGRRTSIDLRIPYFAREPRDEGVGNLFGVAVNVPAAARLSASEVLEAYRLMRGSIGIEQAERYRLIFPGLFLRQEGTAECGNGIHEMFRYLMQERNALELLADVDADPYSGATVHQFFTANIVVNYSTDATLPDGSANPNQLPAGSATLPAADLAYSMPNGTAIGTVRANLANLNPANTEVAPTYIQKVGLLAEYALSHYINPPFSYLDPRGGLSRLEFRILGLPAGVAGYAVGSDFHMELNTSNSDGQNLGTVPHELFHLVQYRYNPGGDVSGGVRQCTVEGGARLLEESINETPNRYVESASEGDLSTTSVPRKGIFSFPGETLLDLGGASSMLRYAAGLLWKYFAEQHSTHTGAADEPAIGVDAYRQILERMAPTADGFTIAAVRNARARLPWYGSFDQFGYYDAAATELDSHETTWGNFLVANYYHRLQPPGGPAFDRRFDYMEDDDPAGNTLQLKTFGPAVAAGNKVTVVQGTAATASVVGHKPYAATYYELTPGSPAPRMLRVTVATTNGMSDPLVQILRIGAANALVDVHRSDRTSWSKTINMSGLTKVVVIVGSREHGGDVTVHFDEVAAATDVMITRWNTAVGTEYEVNPAGWSWAWVSPDIMVDTNDDLLEDGSVFFGQNNKLKVRLRNRGNSPASNIQVDLWYQKATPHLTHAGWIPVQNTAGVTQHLTGLSLAAGAEDWFAADWAPVDDGTHHNHWCVKAVVTVPGDPNADNKVAFRNFDNVAVGGPDTSFDALIRFSEWREGDLLQIVPRGPRATLALENPKSFPEPIRRGCDPQAWQRQLVHGAPLDMVFARLRVVRAELPEWDQVSTAAPEDAGVYYPVDKRTLPPGVDPSEIVTVAHLRDSRPFGGVSYRLGNE